ncbi:MAG TPA: organomercurial lyase [Streptosporangiaceae bacterium]|nr:organomercurial lyase [Streptosporangiaceae bacterium]
MRVDRGPVLYAMCAIDALGIPLMTGRDGVISSVSPGTGDTITVQHRAGIWQWHPATAVVLIADTGGHGPSLRRTCPFITFHASAEHAGAYLRTGALAAGRIVSQREAVDAARAEFGRLLTG